MPWCAVEAIAAARHGRSTSAGRRSTTCSPSTASTPRSSGERQRRPAMDVSVVIGTYNRAIPLGRTLTALRGQRTAPGLTWELVVVDNNSSDETRAVVSAASAAFPVPMRYVFESRQGISHARNAGIHNAKGGIIAV